jgi:hypothetical protein
MYHRSYFIKITKKSPLFVYTIHRKKKVRVIPVPSRDVTTKLPGRE